MTPNQVSNSSKALILSSLLTVFPSKTLDFRALKVIPNHFGINFCLIQCYVINIVVK
ncbi:hypothetical protein SAMN05421824_3046 [Hyunsoonleella jejuensis]|uniref:Uncharacterized protein n=1 Tax=Hyunsoonleella jejuensis TaxID=419940 RepID=A0A1H9LII0_9FLAO|nr:hypothetical protein SAMN05421824_3046 [Hyunsoonleella jejuensis]